MKIKSILIISFFLLSLSAILAQQKEGKCVSGNCIDGIGTFTYSNPAGQVYKGSFKNGYCDGQGTLTTAEGARYIGSFRENMMEGKGTYTFPNGDVYTGEFKGGKIEGVGSAVYQDGYKSAGTWKDNAIWTGYGILNDSTNIYKGEVKEGKYEGKGTYTYANGKSFTGIFHDGLPVSGSGYIKISDDQDYEGNVAAGKLSGSGTLTYGDGSKYTGMFSNGFFNGEGTYVDASGAKYSGTFVEGQLTGQGQYEGNNGTSYVGSFKDYKFDGYGERKYTDGVYKGYWVAGKREGDGKFFDKETNLEYSGKWSNDDRAESGASVSTDSKLELAKEIFGGQIYSGTQQQTIEGYEGSGISIKSKYYIDSDYRISGTITSTISIENQNYSCYQNLSGTYNPDSFELHLDFGDFISSDALPNGLYWVPGGYADGEVYSVDGHPGYYIIKGKTSTGWTFEESDY